MKIINETNIEKAKQLVKKSSDKVIVLQAQDDKFNRALLDYGNFHVLLSVEKDKFRKKVRQENSGFNHVMAKIASKKGIAIGLDIKEIQKLSSADKAIRLSKIQQNVRIARKADTQLVILGLKNKRMIHSLLTSLGASTQQIKSAKPL